MFMYANAHGHRPARRTPPATSSASWSTRSSTATSCRRWTSTCSSCCSTVAGNETTRNAISHGMDAFLEHPDQYRMLVDDPSLLDGAIEEVLRWASPVMYFRRNITEDTEYAGDEMKAGDKASLWYISANRDETVFDDPYRFDITRDPNPHIAFGGGGPHYCLGANLARMEMKLLFERADRAGTADRAARPVRPAALELHQRHQAPARAPLGRS